MQCVTTLGQTNLGVKAPLGKNPVRVKAAGGMAENQVCTVRIDVMQVWCKPLKCR
jgi:hypothetical protein